MSKYLIETTELYRVDSEKEAEKLIQEAKADTSYTVKAHTTKLKERKAKGEVIDEWRQVTIKKIFTDEKEPLEQFTVSYSNNAF